MKKGVLIVASVVMVAAMAGFFLLPPVLDARFNQVVAQPPYEVPAADVGLMDSAVVIDLHADFLLWSRALRREYDRGHMDLPRLERVGMTLQVFSAVTKSPWGQNYERNRGDSDRITPLVIAQRWPVRTWFSLKERALYQAERLHRSAAGSGGRLRVITRRADLGELIRLQAAGEAITGGLLAIEGLHAMEGDLEALDDLVAAGYRMMSFAHFFDTRLAGSAHGMERGPLTPLGRAVLARMEEAGVVVDLAHVSEAAMHEVLDRAQRPLVVSHTGVRGTCAGPRNLSDEIIRRIGDNGGLIGIGVWAGAVCEASPEGIVRAMRHVADLIGPEHVALGSDFDGSIRAAFDVTGLPTLVGPMRAAGFTEAEIRGILGENALALLSSLLPD